MTSFNRLLVVLSFLLLPTLLLATDLRVGRIESPPEKVAVGKPIPVKFWVENINVLDANQYTLTVTITKKGQGSPVYTSTFEATNLPKFDSVLLTAPTQFTPPTEGEYDMTVSVTFSEDINNSNNSKTTTFTAIAAPNLGTRIRQYSYFSPTGDSLSTMGIIDFSIPPTMKPCFINVLVRRTDTSAAVWVVRNLLYMGPDFTPQNRIGMFIDFKDLGFQAGDIADSVILCVTCTDVPLSEQPQPDVTCQWEPVTPTSYAVGEGTVEAAASNISGPFLLDSLPTFLASPSLVDTVERGCTMPNIDLDGNSHPGDSNGYKGDINACAPAAVANSMLWLEQSFPGKISSGLSHRQMLEEISSLSNRPVEEGTSYFNMIGAKLAFIDKYKLPIKVKFQGIWGDAGDVNSPDPRYGHSADYQGAPGGNLAPAKTPKWDWLVKEMQDSEDVEMLFGWWDKTTGERTHGHYVTITGTAIISGQKQFRFKEDADQYDSSGTQMPSVFWKEHPNGRVTIPDLSDEFAHCIVEGVFSESYDTSVKFVEGRVGDLPGNRSLLLSVDKNPSLRTDKIDIHVYIAQPGTYRLAIVDLAGREVVRLTEKYFNFGTEYYAWAGELSNGNVAPSGIYFLTIEGSGIHETVKIIRN